MIYVGRAFHNGDTLVAKVIPSKHIAFISWRGQEIPKYHFEILCGKNLHWQHSYDHVVPEQAILCGETSLGQPIYIGRGHYNGSLTVGKISSVHRALFIAFEGSEKRLESYEILVKQMKPTPGWAVLAPAMLEKKPLPPPPLLVDVEEDIKPVPMPLPPPPDFERPLDAPPPYTAMPMPLKFSYTQPNYVVPPQASPLPEKKFSYAETYVPPPPPSLSYTPAGTYIPPTVLATVTPAETYMPPHQLSPDLWVTAASASSYIPPQAVPGGNEANFAPIYVCRAYHEGHMLPGKFIPSHRCAYVCFNGMEITKYNFEVLVGERYHWVPAYNGNVPPGAVEGGRMVDGEPLFIGRAHHYGSLTPGRIQRSHGCLYIPYGGQEIRHSNYEVLVRSDYFF